MFAQSHCSKSESRRWRWIVVLAVAFGMTAGCSFDGRETDPDGGAGNDSGWTLGDVGGSDSDAPDPDTSMPDVDPDTGVPEPHPTTFRLTNKGKASLFVRKFRGCNRDSPRWLTVEQNGNPIDTGTSCAICDCDQLRNAGGCSVCGAPRCAPPEYVEVKPGQSRSWKWAGRVIERGNVNGQSCEEPTIPKVGEHFSGKFCWRGGGKTIGKGQRNCTTVNFGYGHQTKVEATAKPQKENKPKKHVFEIVNKTNHPLSLRRINNCKVNTQPWVSLRDGSTRVDLGTDCTRCRCEQLSSGSGCAVCTKVCGPAGRTTLQPGGAETYDWYGIGWRREKVNQRSCQRRWIPQDGKKLEARFCFAHVRSGQTEAVRCEPVQFRYGDGKVQKVVIGNRKPSASTIRLINKSGNPIRVQATDMCLPTPPGWLDISRSGHNIDPATNCTECSCRQLENQGSCLRCGVACMPKTVKRLANGDEVKWKWPGRVYKSDVVKGQTCKRGTVPKNKTGFGVRLCWSKKTSPVGSGQTIKNPTCVTKMLTYGVTNSVAHTVQ